MDELINWSETWFFTMLIMDSLLPLAKATKSFGQPKQLTPEKRFTLAATTLTYS